MSYHPSKEELYRWGLFYCAVILLIVGSLVAAALMLLLK